MYLKEKEKENVKMVRKNEAKLNSMNEKFMKDPLKMERITNNDLICRDCKFKFDDTEKPCNTSKCAKFNHIKPNEVLDGKYCLQYERTPKTQNKGK